MRHLVIAFNTTLLITEGVRYVDEGWMLRRNPDRRLQFTAEQLTLADGRHDIVDPWVGFCLVDE